MNSNRYAQPLVRKIWFATAIVLVCVFEVKAQFTKINSPEARYLHQMVYDEGNQQVLVFGGTGGYKLFSDLWAFNNKGWKKLSETRPSGRIKAAFVYDVNEKKAVHFGGAGFNNEL